ncbi:hypothetical protein TIFTF001_026205 [Ficus carica]|uniref:Ubiquitin receptor RAD23 n=1 Tax=Ficus carica TaxID=3494 RepID=A0AA88DKT4_FICCA|nr:hypothetical protein TIFTF001_026205 [Ficus carica]
MRSNARAGNLDFLRNSQQFQAMRAMVQADPQILQPMLQELGKQNPQLMHLIQQNQADYLRLINEPVEGGATPSAVTVTPEEQAAAIERINSTTNVRLEYNNIPMTPSKYLLPSLAKYLLTKLT